MPNYFPTVIGEIVPDTGFFAKGIPVVQVPIELPSASYPNIALFEKPQLKDLGMVCGFTLAALQLFDIWYNT